MTDFGNIQRAASDILIGALSNLPPDVDNWTTDDKLIAQNLVHQFLESNPAMSDIDLTKPDKVPSWVSGLHKDI